MKKSSVTNELVQLKQIEVQEKGIKKWNGTIPNVTGGAMPFFNTNSFTKLIKKSSFISMKDGFFLGYYFKPVYFLNFVNTLFSSCKSKETFVIEFDIVLLIFRT